jgi:hypothetical protein
MGVKANCNLLDPIIQAAPQQQCEMEDGGRRLSPIEETTVARIVRRPSQPPRRCIGEM